MPSRFSALAALLIAGLLALAVTGCDSNDSDAPPTTLSGSFEATTFEVTRSGVPIDVLEDAEGALTMTFDEDGTVQADFEASLPAGDSIDETAEGTYTLRPSGRLTFDFGEQGQALRDELPEDPEFTYQNGEIRTEGEGYLIVLERS